MRKAGLAELQSRWQRARFAALHAVAGSRSSEPEDELIERAFAVDAPEASRRLFENGLNLGRGYARLHGTVELDEVPEVVGALGSPCLSGHWQRLPDEDALILERPRCGASRRVCVAWREAADGLVLGLSAQARTARHRSGGGGDPVCLDVVYAKADSELRYGFFPEDMLRPLEAVTRFLNRLAGTSVRFLGVSEGVLLYELQVDGCGGGAAVTELLRRSIHARWPQLELRDVTPRAVLAADGTDSHLEAP